MPWAPVALGTVGTLERQTVAVLATAHDEAGEAVRTAPAQNVDEDGLKASRPAAVALGGGDRHGGVLRDPRTTQLGRGSRRCRTRRSRGSSAATAGGRTIARRRNKARCAGPIWTAVLASASTAARRKRSAEPARRRPRSFSRRGGTSASGRSTERDSRRRWTRAPLRSARRWSGDAAAPMPRRRRSARTCQRWIRRCGCSRRVRGSIRRTIMPSGSSAAVCCGGRMPSTAIARGGCRFAERMLTVVQTLRLRHRSVLAYLEQAIAAHRNGEPAPELLG